MDKQTVTVCDSCLRASCWKAIFFCDDWQTAGTVEKSVDELKALDREHPDWWSWEVSDG